MKNRIIATALAGLAFAVVSPAAFGALGLEGQSGIFVNPWAYTVAPEKTEAAVHFVSLDSAGNVTTYNVTRGLKGGVEIGYTRIASSVTGVSDQNVIHAKWQFLKEQKTLPAVSVWALNRDLAGGSSPDFGLTATKFIAGQNPLVVSVGVRSTKAVGLGLFGFADEKKTKLEASAALGVTKKLWLATEVKQQIGIRTWKDIAVRYNLNPHLNLDAGLANLGPTIDNQLALAATWAF